MKSVFKLVSDHEFCTGFLLKTSIGLAQDTIHGPRQI